MQFWEAEACGNTFLILRVPHRLVAEPFLHTLRTSGQWTFDSALVLTPDDRASVRMHVVERDGSTSNMCGNGARAVGLLLDQLGLARTIAVGSDILEVERIGTNYAVPLTWNRAPHGTFHRHAPASIRFEVNGEPHAVIEARTIDPPQVVSWGQDIIPAANCTAVARTPNPGVLHALTYERGVNRLTASCGTGACAAVAFMAERSYDLPQTVEVRMTSHTLYVRRDRDHLVLIGSATLNPHTATETLEHAAPSHW